LILILLSTVVLIACKSKKKHSSDEFYWKELAVSENTPLNFSGNYRLFRLNEPAFFRQLFTDTILIPDTSGIFNVFFVQEVQVLSPPLAEKFPEIKTFSGYQIDNVLCQCKIGLKREEPDITVLCNDRTYFVKKNKDAQNNVYIVFDKSDTQNTLKE
jgi:hypothetical protein